MAENAQLPGLARIFHTPERRVRARGLQERRCVLVGRVPSRGALLAFPSECEISRLAPLAGQSESGPKERALEFVGVEQRQLRFPPCFHPRLAGAPAPDEFRHQLAGGLVAYLLKARQLGRPKDFTRILQFIEAGVLDSNKLDQVLRRHRLLAKWERFGDRFLRNL